VLRIATAAACFLSLLAACGDDDEEAGGGGAQAAAADLTVVVRPEGPNGPVRERRVVCERLGAGKPACRGLTAKRLAPVPRLTPCTSIYGGPAVARVTGALQGEPVDARFNRTDGCEIERWDRNVTLLGPPGRGP
jgi:hypothetical protein